MFLVYYAKVTLFPVITKFLSLFVAQKDNPRGTPCGNIGSQQDFLPPHNPRLPNAFWGIPASDGATSPTVRINLALLWRGERLRFFPAIRNPL